MASSVKRRSDAKSSGSAAVPVGLKKLNKVDELVNMKENNKKRPSQGYRRALSFSENRGDVFRDMISRCQQNQSRGLVRNSEDTGKLQFDKGRVAVMGESSPCLLENSTPVMNKGSKTPFLKKMYGSGSGLAKAKNKQVKQVKAECRSNQSVVDCGGFECDLISSGMSEKDLQELDLLPEGLLPKKGTFTRSNSTPAKSQRVTFGDFFAFDGSRFSPIEEASFVLNTANEDVGVSEVSKKVKSDLEDSDLFHNLPTSSPSTEMLEMKDGNADSILALQSDATQICVPWAEDVKNNLGEYASGDKCTLERSTFPNSCINYTSIESLPVQSSLGQMHYISHYPQCDSIASPNLEEHDLIQRRNVMSFDVFENEANKVADELVASAAHSRSRSFDDAFLWDYNERKSSVFPLELSLMHLDDLNGCSNQEPLFWPLAPSSYFSDQDNLESSLHKMDFECEAKTHSGGDMTSKTRSKLSRNESRRNCGSGSQSPSKSKMTLMGQARAEKETPPKDEVYDSKTKTSGKESAWSMEGACNLNDLSFSSSDTKSSSNKKGKHGISSPSRKFSLDSTPRGADGNSCNHLHTDIKNEYMGEFITSANESLKLMAGQTLFNLPELQTGEDSIEILVGMKEFDGQEGLPGLTNGVISAPGEFDVRENLCPDFKCSSISNELVQKGSFSEKADRSAESIRYQPLRLEDCWLHNFVQVEGKSRENLRRNEKLHSCMISDCTCNSWSSVANLEEEFQGLQINPKHNASQGLQNIGYEDCNVISGDKFENVDDPFCFSRDRKAKEAVFSGLLDKAQSKEKSSQLTSACILNENMGETEAEEIKTVTHIHHGDNPISAQIPGSVICLSESEKDLLSHRLNLLVQSGNKLKSFEYNNQDDKNLAKHEFGMERKVKALEAELLEVKTQNKKMERLLKRIVKRTNIMQQSMQDDKRYLHRGRPVSCKFALSIRRKRYTHQRERNSYV